MQWKNQLTDTVSLRPFSINLEKLPIKPRQTETVISLKSSSTSNLKEAPIEPEATDAVGLRSFSISLKKLPIELEGNETLSTPNSANKSVSLTLKTHTQKNYINLALSHSDPRLNFCDFDCIWVKDKKLILYFKQGINDEIEVSRAFQELIFFRFQGTLVGQKLLHIGLPQNGFL